MQKLNLPEYDLKYRISGERKEVFDPFRSRYLVLTPEEYVRQQFAQYLIAEKGYPSTRMTSEYSLKLNNLLKRCDLIAFDTQGKPLLLVECKSPDVKINQAVFDQVARYNLVFRVNYLIVTNGLKHYCCKVDLVSGKVDFLSDIPSYNDITA